jgi:hypothetical protein
MRPRPEATTPRRAIRCWACAELLALRGRDDRLIVDADAETASAGGSPVIICTCGARTILPGDWEIDER